MTREEYLAKRRANYQKNKQKWAEYAKTHRKQINEYRRRKRAENPEKYRAIAKQWRDKNKEHCHELQRKYAHSEKGKAKKKEYYEKNKEAFLRRAMESRAKRPFEVKANRAVYDAIRRGKMTRQPCEVCGDEPAQAHHDDYNYPLKVRWLCQECHAKWHRDNEPVAPTGTKECLVCGRTFAYTHGSQKTCSDKCKKEWKKRYAHDCHLLHKKKI